MRKKEKKKKEYLLKLEVEELYQFLIGP